MQWQVIDPDGNEIKGRAKDIIVETHQRQGTSVSVDDTLYTLSGFEQSATVNTIMAVARPIEIRIEPSGNHLMIPETRAAVISAADEGEETLNHHGDKIAILSDDVLETRRLIRVRVL